MKDLDYSNIPLEDSWLEFHVNKYQEAKEAYTKTLNSFRGVHWVSPEPLAAKTFLKRDDSANESWNHVQVEVDLWKRISDYISENEVQGIWEFSHISQEEVDVNTDPYDDYEELVTMYTVMARVFNEDQLPSVEVVQLAYTQAYNAEQGVIRCKKELMEYLKGEYNR